MAMEWTEELIARLRDLWSQGLSTAEIGRQLSITKNAVVGKAHRLGLPPRPSPIRNKGGVATPRRKPAPRVKKEAAAAEPVPENAQADLGLAPAATTPESPAPEAPAAAPKKPVAAKKETVPAASKPAARAPRKATTRKPQVERPVRQGPTCQWPNGDPGMPGFHFCGATPLPGKPYCAEHAAIAYVKLRDRREG